MKLIACHIDNFGKLSDLDMEFDGGLNVIYEANAWGKSTLATFLRVMFYGFDSKRESGLFDKERLVYKPWQGGVYGGEVDFSHEGKNYRISRTFGKTEKTDEFHLYDLSTNLECHDFSTQIGNELFGLDSASFKRSAFIAQNDCECGSTDAINAKLGNLVENTNDINNFESAQERIHDRMNKMSPDRATGSIRKRMNTITRLTEELRTFQAAENAALELLEMLKEKQEQKKELTDIRSQYASALQIASEESRRESLKVNYEAICKEVKDCREALRPYESIFPNRVPEDEEFKERNQEVQMLGILKTTLYNIGLTDEEQARYEELQETFEKGRPTDEEIENIDRKLDSLNRYRDERSVLDTKLAYYEAMMLQQESVDFTRKRFRALLVFGVICVVLGVAAAAASFFVPDLAQVQWMVWIAAGAVFGIGVLLFLIRAVFLSRDKKEVQRKRRLHMEEIHKLREPIEEIRTQIDEMDSTVRDLSRELSAFLDPYLISCNAPEAKSKLYDLKAQVHEFERLDARLLKSNAASQDCDRTRRSLLAFGKEAGIDFGEDIAVSLSSMQTKAAEYRLARESYDKACEKKRLFEEEYNVAELAHIEKSPYSLDELNEMIMEVDEKLEEVREATGQYNHQLEDLQEQLDARDEKKQQLAQCRQAQEEERHTYEILSLTQNYLQVAKEQFSARYLGPIKNGFQKYYEALTGDRSGEWMVDANIEVQVKQQGELRETKWLSAGYQDLLGVCMRFALVDAMYPDEKPFLVLDDPFVNLDEEKISCGNQLLEQIGAEYQIIYFTCHRSRDCHKGGCTTSGGRRFCTDRSGA